jgi:hypothetical protein
MVPLEVTHTALASPAVLERMFHKGTAVSISPFKALVELLLTFFETTYRCVVGRDGAAHGSVHLEQQDRTLADVLAPQVQSAGNRQLRCCPVVCAVYSQSLALQPVTRG